MPLFDDTRVAWGARPPTSRLSPVAITSRTEFMTHWNGPAVGLAGKPHASCLAAVKADQRYHQDSNGWADIGYNALVCPHGRLIEGRGRDVAGAHCPDHNTIGLGVQVMVGKGETATPVMLARVRRFYDECSALAGRPLRKLGHRDGFATDCPGEQLEEWVKAGMPATPAPAPQPKEWYDMPIPKTDLDAIAERIWTHGGADGMSIWSTLVTDHARVKTLETAVQALAEAKGADAAAITQAVVDKINALELTVTAKAQQ